MNPTQYQKRVAELALKRPDHLTNQELRLCHWCLGLAGEAGEVLEPIKKAIFQRKLLKLDDVKLELGDTLYYLTMIAEELGFTLEEVMQANIDKLNIRYGDK